MHASEKGHRSVVEYLLWNDAQVDLQDMVCIFLTLLSSRWPFFKILLISGWYICTYACNTGWSWRNYGSSY